jgi:prepilin-type N-terminal cleavage/methylation domain-containing protein
MNLKKNLAINRQTKGFTLIEILIVVAILGILASLLLPSAIQAYYKGRAAKVVNDMRVIRDTALRYQVDKNSWPRSRTWGRTPPEFQSYLPPGTSFDLSGWDVEFAFTNYSNKSDDWIEDRGYTVVLRARVQNVMLANRIYKMSPNLFYDVAINKKRGLFIIALE